MKTFHYQDLSSGVEKELTLILGRVTHHIHPHIVDYITQENISYRDRFKDICHEALNIDTFFYNKSDCVFPGFRRPINKEKTPKWKNNINSVDGCILNDNTFPRHIWAFLTMNKSYSGGAKGMWNASGLNRFELAHVFGHKQDERLSEQKIFDGFNNEIQPYGLFTSASNVVLIPKGFAKPTDHMTSVKACFYKRHFNLYGHNISGISNLNENSIPSWYDEIKWLEPQLPSDWQEKTKSLLKYREKHLKVKYLSS